MFSVFKPDNPAPRKKAEATAHLFPGYTEHKEKENLNM